VNACASRCYNEGTKAALAYRERSNLRGLIRGAKKHRSAKILVELQALRGYFGTMFLCSASVKTLSGLTPAQTLRRTTSFRNHHEVLATRRGSCRNDPHHPFLESRGVLYFLQVHQAATGDQASKPVWWLERSDPSQIDFVECRQLCEFRR